EKKETSKHSGAISLFDKDYIKKGIFPKELSRWLHDAFDLRQRSDYAVQYVPSREEAEEIINQAVSFVSHVSEKLREETGG
ncbi:MAG: DNA-binding protein, partial [Deltaproteobacteria bacterium]